MPAADNGFDKSYRLLSADDFSYLRKDSKNFNHKWMRVYYKPSRINSSKSRIGISVTKKVGKANIRNLCKRQVREFFRSSDYKELGLDLLVLVSPRLFKQSENPVLDLSKALDFSFSQIYKRTLK
jgi:ribonuclease P protein component